MASFVWQAAQSLEYFQFSTEHQHHHLQGKIVLSLEGQPTFVTYHIICDANWQTQQVSISQQQPAGESLLHLKRDRHRQWYVDDAPLSLSGVSLPNLQDIDLEITPASNTLPIRRLNLAVGQTVEVNALWVRFPGLTLEPLEQRYTRLSPTLYDYHVPQTGFKARLMTDEEGFILTYEGLWRRL